MSSAARRTERLGMLVLSLVVALLAMPSLVSAAPGRGVLPQAAADMIEVVNQSVVGSANIQRVQASQAGWLVVYLDAGGSPGTKLGQTAIPQGESRDVVVAVSKDVQVNTRLWAKLHVDGGTKGEFEFPGPDSPVFVNNEAVEESFFVAPSVLPPTGATRSYAALLTGALLALLAGAWLRLRAARSPAAR